MLPFWFLFVLPAYLAISRIKPTLQTNQTQRGERFDTIWKFVFVFLVLMIGLRHEVGGDWFSYTEEIERIRDGFTEIGSKIQDPMFILFNSLAVSLGFGVYFVNVLSAIFFTYGLLVFCREQPRPWLSLTVAVPYLITVVAMGYTRQGAAIGVAMLGMVALSKGRISHFLLWITLASTFHKSAIILAPLALLGKTQRRIFTLIGVSLVAIILYILLLLESVDFLIHGYLENEYQSSGAAIRIGMNAFPAIIFLIFRKRFHLTSEQSSFWTWMSWGALFLVLMLKESPSSTAVDRIALYWIPIQLFVLSRIPDAFGEKGKKNPFLVYLVIAYSAIVHFVWLTFADTAFAWIPYQFYPWILWWN